MRLHIKNQAVELYKNTDFKTLSSSFWIHWSRIFTCEFAIIWFPKVIDFDYDTWLQSFSVAQN